MFVPRVCARAYGALELRNGLDLPSAALMHANLPLVSQENIFSHSTNKVQTPPPPSHPECWQRGTVQMKHMHEKARQSSGVSCRSPVESRVREHRTCNGVFGLHFNGKEEHKEVWRQCFFTLEQTQLNSIWIHLNSHHQYTNLGQLPYVNLVLMWSTVLLERSSRWAQAK